MYKCPIKIGLHNTMRVLCYYLDTKFTSAGLVDPLCILLLVPPPLPIELVDSNFTLSWPFDSPLGVLAPFLCTLVGESGLSFEMLRVKW